MDDTHFERQRTTNPILDRSLSSRRQVEARFADYLNPKLPPRSEDRETHRKLRIARARAVKKARELVGGRPLTMDEIAMIDQEIAKYA